jgi:flagellar basal-body rod modification protein FlgD
MAYEVTSAATAGSIAGTSATANAGLGGLDSTAFLKLLVAQLRYQHPLSPSDPSAMLQQTASFTQVETLQQLAKAQQQILVLQQTAMAADLIGKDVSATAADGTELRGTVDAVRFNATGPVLLVGGSQVPLNGALEIRSRVPQQ